MNIALFCACSALIITRKWRTFNGNYIKSIYHPTAQPITLILHRTPGPVRFQNGDQGDFLKEVDYRSLQAWLARYLFFFLLIDQLNKYKKVFKNKIFWGWIHSSWWSLTSPSCCWMPVWCCNVKRSYVLGICVYNVIDDPAIDSTACLGTLPLRDIRSMFSFWSVWKRAKPFDQPYFYFAADIQHFVRSLPNSENDFVFL